MNKKVLRFTVSGDTDVEVVREAQKEIRRFLSLKDTDNPEDFADSIEYDTTSDHIIERSSAGDHVVQRYNFSSDVVVRYSN